MTYRIMDISFSASYTVSICSPVPSPLLSPFLPSRKLIHFDDFLITFLPPCTLYPILLPRPKSTSIRQDWQCTKRGPLSSSRPPPPTPRLATKFADGREGTSRGAGSNPRTVTGEAAMQPYAPLHRMQCTVTGEVAMQPYAPLHRMQCTVTGEVAMQLYAPLHRMQCTVTGEAAMQPYAPLYRNST
jgi:hypothetical protein